MNRIGPKMLIGLVVALALAFGASSDMRAAAKAAAKATANASAKANGNEAGKPAAGATTTARAMAKPAPKPEPTTGALLPSKPLTGATVAAAPQAGATHRKGTRDAAYAKKFQKIDPAAQKAAAAAARARGLRPGVAGRNKLAVTLAGNDAPGGGGAFTTPLPGIEGPGGIPHYFGPYGNWAFSPLPKGGVASVTILNGGIGYTNPIIVIDDAYGTGASFTIPTTQLAGVVQPPTLAVPVGSNISAPIATVVDDPALCGGAAQPVCGTGALADALIGGPVTGGIRKFVDGLPGLGPGGVNNLGQYIPIGVPSGWPLGCAGAACTADYYEIGLVEYIEKMHSDLPATTLRGYVQIVPAGWTGVDALGNALTAVPLTTANGLVHDILIGGSPAFGATKPHYLGPTLVAMGRVHGIAGAAGNPKPVRIKFYNLLPNGAGGDLLLPVDETVPGAGDGAVAGQKYSQNRATIHLHGNNTVWISDGNTHQWITPAGESTAYPAGVSARNVPDMAGCASDGTHPELPGTSGCMTFYYTNAQSARLQFYHDHAHGITRLNVYAGEAAGYLITDAVEQDMIAGTNVSGVNPGLLHVLPGLGTPLVIQDKTWVDADTVFAQDPTWNAGTGPRNAAGNITAGVTGDFWYPHVYMTVTNPWDPTGTNPYGRWFYGPWFNPPTPECVNGLPVGCIEIGPVPNEYYDQLNAPWEPPLRPGVPNPSIPGESFLDTPIVNGTAYPVLHVEPKAVRFRILSAGNDRGLNLQLYVAADKKSPTIPGSTAVPCNGAVPVGDCTEVAMVPVSVNPANQFADTPSGIPDPTLAGPDWWLIGTEGGFVPAPVVVPPMPIGYNLDPAYFNFGVVNQHSLFLMPAERADVVVDFSAYAGKTLILYNDSPAPIPAGAAPYDNYTGDGNLIDSGGAPNTLPGYGPNTRTIMQIQVGSAVTTPTTDVTLANLQAVFAKTATKRGVFEVSQDTIIVPQAAYNTAYNNTFPADASQYVLNIGDKQKTFQPIDANGVLQAAVTIPFEMKAMHDEMGGVYDTMFGRMSGMLGLTNPNSALGFILPLPFSSPPTDIVKGSTEATPIGQLADGTQLWRIFHNGVDTHPIHTHLFTAQILSRVGQDGQVAPGTFPAGLAVDASDVGWKDTFKVNPLEITFLALRPTVPTPSQVPFELPDSVRLIDPLLPDGAVLPPPGPAGWFDPNGNALPEIRNHYVNFGWEYVWHCHILSHEEMDFMHSLVFAVPPTAVNNLAVTRTNTTVRLTWTDRSPKELRYRIERATNPTFTTGFATFTSTSAVPTGARTFTQTVQNNRAYWYRVVAVGPDVGDVATAGFPTMATESVSNTVVIQVGTLATPAAPIGLSGTWQPGQPPQVNLAWTDMSTNETHFVMERCTGLNCATFAALPAVVPSHAGTGLTGFVDTTVVATNVYSYRVRAFNGTTASAYSNIAQNVADPGAPVVPVAPTGLTVVIAAGFTNLSWSHPGGTGLIDFTVQRAVNASFTLGVTSQSAAAAARTSQIQVPGGPYYYRIRANGSTASSAWTNASPFPVAGPVTVGSVTADQTLPMLAGGAITWTATANGGTSPLQYQFWLFNANTATWTIAQPYGTSNTYTSTPSVGRYVVEVWVRNAGSAGPDATLQTSTYDVNAPPVVLTGLSANRVFPVPGGTSVTWTATATGGVAPLQYQFWLFNAGTGTWTIAQPYGTSNTYTSTPAAGRYVVEVWVRSAGSPGPDATLQSLTFVVQ
jgi:FtsP/CotA-like multicopper oxidase with cupredoxin domain